MPGPVTITLPDAGKRFMSMQVIDEDQYTPQVVYGAGSHTLTKEKVGTRYVIVGDPDPRRSGRPEGRGGGPRAAGRDQGRAAGRARDSSRCRTGTRRARRRCARRCSCSPRRLPDTKADVRAEGQVDPVRHLIGSASAWGGNPGEGRALPQRHAEEERRQDGLHGSTSRTCRSTGSGRSASTTPRATSSRTTPNAYTLNNVTAKKGADGSVTVQFGGCDGKVANCLPIMPGWNYLVRLYRPRPEVLSGAWRFPQAQAVH